MIDHPNRLSRRALLAQASAAGVAIVTTAHVQARAQVPFHGSMAAPLAAQDAAGPVSFMNWSVMEGTPTEAAIQTYQQQSKAKVEIVPAPGTGTDYETKVRTMLAGGTVPDIIRVNDDFVRFYSFKQQFTDLQSFMDRDGIDPAAYYEPVFNFPRQPDNRYTAWALGNQPRMIYYNVDLFKAAGVPLPPADWSSKGWTWDDFVETAKKLTVEGKQWGALVYDDTGCEQTFSVNNGLTEGIYSEDGKSFLLAEPQGVEAIQWLADLTLVHKVQPERGLVTEANSGNNLFLQGKVAMIFRTQGTMAYFRKNNPTFTWDVAAPPAKADQKTEGSLICYAIPTAAKNPDGAWELLKFLGGKGGSDIFAERSDFIPAFTASAEGIKAKEGVAPAHLGLFTEAMKFQTTVNFTENTENARNIYRPQLDLVWNGDSTAEDVLGGVRQDVEETLSGAF